MIPKIIHYCWLSDEPMPGFITRCISGWKERMPDYRFILWDKKQFDITSVPWVREAYEAGKYAFAADYIRLYSVYTYGGIYLDTDVEALRSFDALSCLPYFVGLEFNDRLVEAATFGAEKGQAWVGQCLAYYKDRHFIKADGSQDTRVLPAIMRDCILANYPRTRVVSHIPERYDPAVFYLFTSDYFSPKSCYSRKIKTTPRTFSIHHFSTAWMSPWGKFVRYAKHIAYKVYTFLFRVNDTLGSRY